MNLGGSKTFTFDFGFLLGLNCGLDEVKIGKLWRGGAGVGVGDDCVSEADGGVAAGGGGGVVGDSGGVEAPSEQTGLLTSVSRINSSLLEGGALSS